MVRVNYEIKVNSNKDILVISHVGYRAQEIRWRKY